ncbi:MAG: acyltransferase family protein [Bacteroidales bacterium]|nr:acyltransferase family protein [Bacteroidales bacterium]
MECIYNLEGKNKAIVLFKFFAALLITYSHMAILFPKFNWLVTGGAIGDGLFFFCSGFTLFLGRKSSFSDWYGRRVSRIYPSIIMWALLSALFFGWEWSVTDLLTTPKYWFIPCIMVYYAIFYLVREFLAHHLNIVFYVSLALITMVSFFVLDMDNSVMYAQVSFMRVYYFIFMLIGAVTAVDLKKEQKERVFGFLWNGNGGVLRSTFLFVMSIVLYYACMAAYKLGPFYCHFQMVSLLPLMAAIYYLFVICSDKKLLKVFDMPIVGNVVYVISSLTLEIYLVQYAIFTDRLNSIFPLNIFVVYLAIFAVAYILKCFSNLFTLVFSNSHICLKQIFSI